MARAVVGVFALLVLVLALACAGPAAAEPQGVVSLLELQQVHLHPQSPEARENALRGLIAPQATGTRPGAPQFGNPAAMLGSGTANSFAPGAPELLMAQQAGKALPPQAGITAPNFSNIPPSMYFTSPFDYEADDAANPAADDAAPDTWFERVGKAKDMHKRTYQSISQGQVPRMGWMGTGVHRPVNHLIEAQELSDIDPWRQLATQQYAFFRSPARNPEMRGSTLRRLQKSEVTGFDHTNGQYGLPLGTGLRGVGTTSMGLTKFDYGPFGLGPMHPNPLAHAYHTAVQSTLNQAAAPVGMTAALGFAAPVMPFS